MALWEFLIQKEGDRSWLPLESSNAEILEGRYRIVARTDRVNAPVEIRVIHNALHEDPPKRRLQKRSSKTNPDGLIVVIPFTRLHAGVWQLRCNGDVMSEMMGEGWQHQITLQVLSHEIATDGDWELDWDQPLPDERQPSTMADCVAEAEADAAHVMLHTHKPSLVATSALSSAESAEPPVESEESIDAPLAAQYAETELPEDNPSSQPLLAEQAQINRVADVFDEDITAAQATQSETEPEQLVETTSASLLESLDLKNLANLDELSEEFVAALFQEFETEAFTPAPVVHELASSTPVAAAEGWRIRLEPDTYIAQAGESLTLSGTIEAIAPEETNLQRLARLQIVLRNPQDREILVELSHSIELQSPDCPFEQVVHVPAEAATRLMLGEVLLYSLEDTVLASQPFTLTSDIDTLLSAIAADTVTPEAAAETLTPTSHATVVPLNLDFLNFVKLVPTAIKHQVVEGQALPPQIQPVTAPAPSTRSLELPIIERSSAVLPQESPLSTAAAEPSTQASSRVELPSLPTEGPPMEEEIDDSFVASSDDQPDDEPVACEQIPAVEQPVGSEQPDEPQDHQPDRSLVQAPIDSASSASESASPTDQAFRALNLQQRFFDRLSAFASDAELAHWLNRMSVDPTTPPQDAPRGLDAEWVAQEFVVDEEQLTDAATADSNPNTDLNETDTNVLPKTVAVPLPKLHIAAAELISGQSVTVTAQLPDMPYRFYIKLWLHDRQTLTVLNGPHWLVHAIPTRGGQLEYRTQISVPFGCTQVQVEAIAIEMATQRESHKATLERAVVPPNLPSLSFDDFDFSA